MQGQSRSSLTPRTGTQAIFPRNYPLFTILLFVQQVRPFESRFAGCQVPQTFDGVPHPCGFRGAGFDSVLTSSLQLLTCALFPLAIREPLPQRDFLTSRPASAPATAKNACPQKTLELRPAPNAGCLLVAGAKLTAGGNEPWYTQPLTELFGRPI
jgi:hypothetical protein